MGALDANLLRVRGGWGERVAIATRLERGRRYRRIDLHVAGLGGERRKRISYPARGDHALLFSGGAGEGAYGYRDAWESPAVYRYFGEWSGYVDMELRAGTAKIVERSPHLYLFTASGGEWAFEGRFRHLEHGFERTEREGHSLRAIVFRLERVAASAVLTADARRR